MTTLTINPCDGMTRTGFTILLEENDISRMDDTAVSYYYNLWIDTLRHDSKVGASHDFDVYITWMKKQRDVT